MFSQCPTSQLSEVSNEMPARDAGSPSPPSDARPAGRCSCPDPPRTATTPTRHTRTCKHEPGSQPPFSLIPDPDQNKEDTSLISVVPCSVYIPISRPIQFYFFQTKISRKMPKILQNLWYPGSKIQVGFCRFSWGSKHFIEEIPCPITHLIIA